MYSFQNMRFNSAAADFAAEAVDFVIGQRAELALQFLRQFDPEFALEQIGDAAFAALAVDADDFAIFAADVVGIDGEIRHVPMRAAALFPLAQSLS